MSTNKEFRINIKDRGIIQEKLTEYLKALERVHSELESREKIILLTDPQIQKVDETKLLQEEVHKLKDRLEFESTRTDNLEYRINIAKFIDRIGKIEEFAAKVFSDISNIKHVSYYPTEDGLEIIIIHDFDNRIEALDITQKCLFQMEDAFTEIYFEPTILHISEVDSELLRDVKTILQR